MPNSAAGGVAVRRSLRSLELRCPPLPETLSDALALMENPDRLEIGTVVDSVQRDPIVLARLLHTANSAYYGLRQTVNSAERAVGMLGPVAVTGLVLGMQMVELRSVVAGPASICFRRLIRHSAATAFLTRHIFENAGSGHAPVEGSYRMSAGFTAGMLHDFGKILLVYNFQEEAAELYDPDIPSHIDQRALERERFGCDHTEVGEFAARKLSFPEDLVAVIRHHHSAADRRTSTPLVRATLAANLAAKAMGFGFTSKHDPSAITDNPVWQQIIDLDRRQFRCVEEFLEEILSLEPAVDHYVARIAQVV